MALSERDVHFEVRELLMSGEPFQYAHLVKFERPSRPDELSGRISTSAQRYTYLTDASRDVIFDDRSKDLNGAFNGAQTYIANKVLGVSNVQEAVEAKADNCTLTLDGNGIGGAVVDTVTITQVNSKTWDIQWKQDLVAQGFREGDKVTFSGERTGAFNIETFRSDNVTRVTKIDNDLVAGEALVTAILDSEEIKSILLNKNSSSYASFINREVFIYRAYFKEGKLVGEIPDSEGRIGPVLLFRGIINNVAFDDDDTGIKVQWGLTSHWGDFSQIRGRITSDEFHRALDQNGIPQPYSAIKAIYAYDKGFMHSDTSLNMLATYTVMVDKTTIKAKNGFLGIGAKTKVKTVPVAEGRNTSLNFQLQAKSIPIVYGVRSLQGLPIFADTLKSDSSQVFIAYALSEGEIGGIYDVYVEGKSLICNNKEDLDARGTQNSTDTVDLVCRGRADRGDVLGGVSSTGGNYQNYYDNADLRDMWRLPYNRNSVSYYQSYTGVEDEDLNLVAQNGKGIIHGESIRLTSPQEIVLDVFSGTESQAAASQLVSIAAAKNFKVQNDYWKGTDNAEYWGPNHRLIDTAYVVGKFKIKEGETTIPDIEFIVRGKALDCYNYDYSYAHDDKMTTESPSNFSLGDMVTLSTGQTVQIIDKWVFSRPDGVLDTRFRFSEAPDLQYEGVVPAIKRFSMTKGGSTWTMITYNWVVHEGTVGSAIRAPAVIDDSNPDNVIITYPPTPTIPGGGVPNQPSPIYSVIDENNQVYRDALISGSVTNSQIVSQMV